ncbi:MAG: hypothetical protein RR734_04235 [Bacilli bacterium]
MKQLEFLKFVFILTPFLKRKLERYIINSLLLNDENKNMKPIYCQYYNKKSDMIKKVLNHASNVISVKNVIIFLSATLIKYVVFQNR